jgi:hypothetical protein
MSKPNPSISWFTSKAYSLDSMENQRYNKVRRENMIIKQVRSTAAGSSNACSSLSIPTGYVCTEGLGSRGRIVGNYDTTSRLNGAGTLIWAPIISTKVIWSVAASTCSSLSNSVFSSGWRQPTQQELSGLYNAGTGPLSVAGWTLSRTWASIGEDLGGRYSIDLQNGLLDDNFDDYNSNTPTRISSVSCVHEVL